VLFNSVKNEPDSIKAVDIHEMQIFLFHMTLTYFEEIISAVEKRCAGHMHGAHLILRLLHILDRTHALCVGYTNSIF
jgi:hypothetical protein